MQEDLHSPETYFRVGLEDTRNLEISKSLSNAESSPRDQNSSISYPFGFPIPPKAVLVSLVKSLVYLGKLSSIGKSVVLTVVSIQLVCPSIQNTRESTSKHPVVTHVPNKAAILSTRNSRIFYDTTRADTARIPMRRISNALRSAANIRMRERIS